jgi:hypothetical protein
MNVPAGHLAQAARLFVFGFLAFTPSKECRLCLLTKFGLAYSTARLFRRLAAERCLAFNVFDALPLHTIAAAYSGPIYTTGQN